MAELKAAELIVETAKAEAPIAAKPVETPKVESPVAAKPAVAATPAPAVKAEAKPETSQPAKKAAAVRVTKSRPARKAKPVKKTRPTVKAAVKSVRKPARAGAKTRIQGAKIMTKTNTTFAAADQFKNVFGDVNERAKTAMEKSAKIVEEFADLTRGNVEAIVASSKLAAKGVESLSQDAAEYSRKSFEEASTALKSFTEVKSATDLFKLQSEFARSAFDAAVAESARASETFLKIAGDVVEPITSRYTVAAERVKTLAA